MNLLLDVLVPQLARPHGVLGPWVASMLDRGNRDMNLHVIAALDLTAGDRVLEVGFGGGVGLALALQHEPKLALTGIDPSPEMVQRCRKRFGDGVTLLQGAVETMALPDASFDKVYGVNVAYFWPDLARALAELRRVLRPGGQLVLGVRPRETLLRFRFDEAGHRVWNPEQYADALRAAGYEQASARRVPDASGAAVVSARRPAS